MVLAAGLAAAILAPLSAHVGYRVLFRKDPEIMREIRESADRQSELDQIFAEPTADAQ